MTEEKQLTTRRHHHDDLYPSVAATESEAYGQTSTTKSHKNQNSNHHHHEYMSLSVEQQQQQPNETFSLRVIPDSTVAILLLHCAIVSCVNFILNWYHRRREQQKRSGGFLGERGGNLRGIGGGGSGMVSKPGTAAAGLVSSPAAAAASTASPLIISHNRPYPVSHFSVMTEQQRKRQQPLHPDVTDEAASASASASASIDALPPPSPSSPFMRVDTAVREQHDAEHDQQERREEQEQHEYNQQPPTTTSPPTAAASSSITIPLAPTTTTNRTPIAMGAGSPQHSSSVTATLMVRDALHGNRALEFFMLFKGLLYLVVLSYLVPTSETTWGRFCAVSTAAVAGGAANFMVYRLTSLLLAAHPLEWPWPVRRALLTSSSWVRNSILLPSMKYKYQSLKPQTQQQSSVASSSSSGGKSTTSNVGATAAGQTVAVMAAAAPTPSSGGGNSSNISINNKNTAGMIISTAADDEVDADEESTANAIKKAIRASMDAVARESAKMDELRYNVGLDTWLFRLVGNSLHEVFLRASIFTLYGCLLPSVAVFALAALIVFFPLWILWFVVFIHLVGYCRGVVARAVGDAAHAASAAAAGSGFISGSGSGGGGIVAGLTSSPSSSPVVFPVNAASPACNVKVATAATPLSSHHPQFNVIIGEQTKSTSTSRISQEQNPTTTSENNSAAATTTLRRRQVMSTSTTTFDSAAAPVGTTSTASTTSTATAATGTGREMKVQQTEKQQHKNSRARRPLSLLAAVILSRIAVGLWIFLPTQSVFTLGVLLYETDETQTTQPQHYHPPHENSSSSSSPASSSASPVVVLVDRAVTALDYEIHWRFLSGLVWWPPYQELHQYPAPPQGDGQTTYHRNHHHGHHDSLQKHSDDEILKVYDDRHKRSGNRRGRALLDTARGRTLVYVAEWSQILP